MRVVAHEPGGQVRDHLVAEPRQFLGQVQRGVQALGGGSGHGHRHAGRDPLRHRVRHAAGREHLIPRVLEQRGRGSQPAPERPAPDHGLLPLAVPP